MVPADLRRRFPDVRVVHVHQLNEKVSYQPYRMASHAIFSGIRRFLTDEAAGFGSSGGEGAASVRFPVEEASIDELFIDATSFFRWHEKGSSSPLGWGSLENQGFDEDTASSERSPMSPLPLTSAGAAGAAATAFVRFPAIDAVERLCVRLQDYVHLHLGYHCTLGVGHNRLMAKWAAGLAKPRRIAIALTTATERGLLCGTPVKKLPRWNDAKNTFLVDVCQCRSVASVQSISLDELVSNLGSDVGTAVYWQCRGDDHGRSPDLCRRRPPKAIAAHMSLSVDQRRRIPVFDSRVPQPRQAAHHARQSLRETRARSILSTMAMDLCDKIKFDGERHEGRYPQRLTFKFSLCEVAEHGDGSDSRAVGPALQTAPMHCKFPPLEAQGTVAEVQRKEKVAQLAFGVLDELVSSLRERHPSRTAGYVLCYGKFVLEASHFSEPAKQSGQSSIRKLFDRARSSGSAAPTNFSQHNCAGREVSMKGHVGDSDGSIVEVLDLSAEPARAPSAFPGSPEVVVVEVDGSEDHSNALKHGQTYSNVGHEQQVTTTYNTGLRPCETQLRGFAAASALESKTPGEIFSDPKMADAGHIRQFIKSSAHF